MNLLRLLIPSFLLLMTLSCSPWEEQGYVNINQTRLYYHAIGKGEPVIILHGGPGLDHGYFLPQMSRLAAHHRLVFYDQRACGKSSVEIDPKSMRMEEFVQDLEEIRKHFAGEKMHLVGHSWGGLLAMFYAVKHPEHIKSLTLISSVGANKEYASHSSRIRKERTSKSDSIERANIIHSEALNRGEIKEYEKLYKLIFKSSFYDSLYADSLSMQFDKNFLKTQRLINYLSEDLVGYDLYPALQEKVNFPVMIIHGDYDFIPLEVAHKLHNTMKDSKLLVLKNCGHFPYIERPEEFFKPLEDFWDQVEQQ